MTKTLRIVRTSPVRSLDALNYRITPAFLDERFRHYRAVVDRFGSANEGYLEVLAKFLESRPAFVRNLLVRYLELNPLHLVQLEGPLGVAFRINGREVAPGFSGWYVHGAEIRVGLAEVSRDFSHWNVGGLRVPFPEVWRRVGDDVVIKAQFRRAT